MERLKLEWKCAGASGPRSLPCPPPGPCFPALICRAVPPTSLPPGPVGSGAQWAPLPITALLRGGGWAGLSTCVGCSGHEVLGLARVPVAEFGE